MPGFRADLGRRGEEAVERAMHNPGGPGYPSLDQDTSDLAKQQAIYEDIMRKK